MDDTYVITINKAGIDYEVLIDSQFRWIAKKFSWCLWKGAKNKSFYAVRGVRTEDNKVFLLHLHRLMAFALPGERVSFLSGNSLDCRRSNLLVDNECVLDLKNRDCVTKTNHMDYVALYV